MRMSEMPVGFDTGGPYQQALRKELMGVWRRLALGVCLPVIALQAFDYRQIFYWLFQGYLAVSSLFSSVLHVSYLVEVWASDHQVFIALALAWATCSKFALANAALHLIPQVVAPIPNGEEIAKGARWLKLNTKLDGCLIIAILSFVVIGGLSALFKLITGIEPDALATVVLIPGGFALLMGGYVLNSPLVLPASLRKGKDPVMSRVRVLICKNSSRANGGQIWSYEGVTDGEAVKTLRFLANRRLRGTPFDEL